MPSASDYTTYLKYQAAIPSIQNGMPPRPIQNVTPVSTNIALINSYVRASEASFLANRSRAAITGTARVQAQPPFLVNTQRTTQLYVPHTTREIGIVSTGAPRTVCYASGSSATVVRGT